MSYQQKKCCTCKQKKPLDQFHRDRRQKDLKSVRCKECCKEYYQKNREKKLNYQKAYNKNNKERLEENNKNWVKRNRERLRQYQGQWRRKNRDLKRLYNKKYQKTLKESQ